jgi:hypothetical protein
MSRPCSPRGRPPGNRPARNIRAIRTVAYHVETDPRNRSRRPPPYLLSISFNELLTVCNASRKTPPDQPAQIPSKRGCKCRRNLHSRNS